MRKWFCIILVIMCSLVLCACSNLRHVEELDKWDCSVTCSEESVDNYVITYSDEKIISQTGVLSFQNRNDFDMVVHLLAAGEEERTVEIPAGGAAVLYQVKKEPVYTVGCHAKVEKDTEIKLMVYDGEEAEIY